MLQEFRLHGFEEGLLQLDLPLEQPRAAPGDILPVGPDDGHRRSSSGHHHLFTGSYQGQNRREVGLGFVHIVGLHPISLGLVLD